MNNDVPVGRPFEADPVYLESHLDEMVSATFADLQSQFLILPKGSNFVEYQRFQDAFEVLRRYTSAFSRFNEENVWNALREDALSLLVLRTILGLSPPEWADLARSERASDVSQGYSRLLDGESRIDRALFSRLCRPRDAIRLTRAEALVSVAVEYIDRGAPMSAQDTVHRLAKADTTEGIASLQYVASYDVPYAVLLYERY